MTHKYSIRGDHHLDSDTVFGRFSWQNSPDTFHYGPASQKWGKSGRSVFPVVLEAPGVENTA